VGRAGWVGGSCGNPYRCSWKGGKRRGRNSFGKKKKTSEGKNSRPRTHHPSVLRKGEKRRREEPFKYITCINPEKKKCNIYSSGDCAEPPVYARGGEDRFLIDFRGKGGVAYFFLQGRKSNRYFRKRKKWGISLFAGKSHVARGREYSIRPRVGSASKKKKRREGGCQASGRGHAIGAALTNERSGKLN